MHETHKFAKIVISAIVILIICFGGFFLAQAFLNQPSSHPGELSFENLNETQTNFLNSARENYELLSDITVSTFESHQKLDPTPDNYLLFDIKVPITDFYDPKSSLNISELDNAKLISVNDLTFTDKLLAITDETGTSYYLQDFNSGAIFEYLVFKDSDPKKSNSEAIPSLLNHLTETASMPTFPTSNTTLSFAQTGVTALSRHMTTKLSVVKDAHHFAAKIASYLSRFDLTHTSNEASFSTSANNNNICSQPAMIDVLTDIGLDIVELTGNHNLDCGDEAAISTIDLYSELNIDTVGGGKTAEAAALPLEIDLKDNHLTMLAYNLSTGGYTLDETPGANFYTEEKATEDITTAKARGDFVIVDIQYYECNNYDNTEDNSVCDYANSAAGDQIGFFRHLIDLSADLVVGTAAHQPQTFELYHDKPIYYGLGNLFFDQSWWPGTTRSLILEHYFYQNRLLQTRIVPTVYDSNFQTELMDPDLSTIFINRLIEARPN